LPLAESARTPRFLEPKDGMNDDLQEMMREATRLTQAGRLIDATAAIQRALKGDAAMDPEPLLEPEGVQANPDEATQESPWVLDGYVFELAADTAPAAVAAGTFSSGLHSHAGLTRRYKLYAPPASSNAPRPLVLMLHGCTQNADDFAAGTAMNELAREQGFFVLYPEQSHEANPSRCWNWFKHNHQQRGRGEPALLANLTQAMIHSHGIDPRRVYLAGLSAGGAMAAIVACAYTDLFAAVGIHSGLPSGAARSLPEALAAMKTGAVAGSASPAQQAVPTIVFHGDQDPTVHPRNGELLMAAVPTGAVRVEAGVSAQGRRYTRQIHEAEDGTAWAEHWLVHGAGHAWSGGRAGASYTDASGPDASAEMLRFFLEHPRAAPS
jgi:poly(hydroxyalkanoate) depolymerase family esterase